jgi:hypothetical protein
MTQVLEKAHGELYRWYRRGWILCIASLPVTSFAYFGVGYSILSNDVVRDHIFDLAVSFMLIFTLLLIPSFMSLWVNGKLKKPGLALALSAPTFLLVCVMDGYVVLALIWEPLMILLRYLGL